jgi:tetratricopeptide (TPR) repeat protein
MRLVSWYIIGLILFTSNSFSQTYNSDSLKLGFKTAKHDTDKCSILFNLSKSLLDEKTKYIKELYQLAETRSKTNTNNAIETRCFKKYTALALNELALIFYEKGEVIQAIKTHEASLKIREAINDLSGIASSFNNLAIVYYTQGDIPKAIDYFQKSLKMREATNDQRSIAGSLNNLGAVYKNQGNVFKALDYYGRSLTISEKLGNTKGVASCLTNIGIIYQEQGDIKKAYECFTKSLKIHEANKDKSGISILLGFIAICYANKTNIEKALMYNEQSLKLKEELEDKSGIAEILDNIGNCYNIKGNITLALNYHKKALKMYEEIEYTQGVAGSLNYLGELYYKEKNHQQAIECFSKSLTIANKLQFPDIIKTSALGLYQNYKKINDVGNALNYFELYTRMKDSVANDSTKSAIMKSQYQIEYQSKVTADSVRIAADKKITAIQFQQEKNQRYALYGGLIIVVLFAAFMFNRFKVSQKQRQIIEQKEKETQHQKQIIEEKHKEITDSITYAERIQRSFLASKELLDANLEDYFIVFKPKDVVSGDFYWAASTDSATNKKFLLCTADSTGHGVPGAIMSLLNITSLEKAVEHHSNPAEILNETRQTIINRLKKDGSIDGGKDGMDCSVLCFDFKTNILQLAVANSFVWIVKTQANKELIEIKPDKMPVGKHDKQNSSFTLHELNLQKGDIIYTLTDGFSDQFGGQANKKFLTKNLRSLILTNAHLPLLQQKETLNAAFENWQQTNEQVDDVTLIGIRI